ncbi:MAG: glycosyltransferase family 2 protein, partial [Gelidibacter sp.]
AEGEFLLPFDADDECFPNALEVFENEYNEIPEDIKPKITALTGLCVDQHGNLIGDKYPTDPFYSHPFEHDAVARVKGEKWGFTKTADLRKVKYPEAFISNGFMPESLIWYLIGKEGYMTKFFNKVVRVYYINAGDSISSSGVDKTALGSTVNFIAVFNWFFNDYYYKAPIFFMKYLYLLLRLSKHTDFNLKSYTTSIDSPFIKFLFIILWPVRKFLR